MSNRYQVRTDAHAGTISVVDTLISEAINEFDGSPKSHTLAHEIATELNTLEDIYGPPTAMTPDQYHDLNQIVNEYDGVAKVISVY
jgi:N-acetylglucosamine kinase-like BadF-type ATPase